MNSRYKQTTVKCGALKRQMTYKKNLHMLLFMFADTHTHIHNGGNRPKHKLNGSNICALGGRTVTANSKTVNDSSLC